MKPELWSALADLQEETVHLCRRIRQSRSPGPLTSEFGTDSPSNPGVTAGVGELTVAHTVSIPENVGELKVAHTVSIPEKTYVVQAAPGTVTQPRQQFANLRQVRNDTVIPNPKPAGAHHILLLVLVATFVIILAIAIQMQTEINEFVSQWLPVLEDAATEFGILIRTFWLKA